MNPEEIYNEACKAGEEAGNAYNPVPMIVQTHENCFDDSSKVVAQDFISEGVCGFAWVLISPARGKFVTWCRKNNIGGLAYEGGWRIGVRGFGQSMQRKEAYAEAFSNILNKYDIKSYYSSRLD